MEAPPHYSPTARASERRLLLGNQDPLLGRDDEDDYTFSHARGGPLGRPQTRESMSSREEVTAFSTLVTLPSISSSLSYSPADSPPEYAAVDELAHSFRLDAPFIYTTKTSNVPRYQLMQEFTHSGKPRQLCIRRLMANETRLGSLPCSSPRSRQRIRYDGEGTMYSITSYEMRGHRSTTLMGSIKIESGKSLRSGNWAKVWQYTRNRRRDSLNPENDAATQKYGYHGDKEWDKKLLFWVKKGGVWEDGEGRVVARERMEDGQVMFDLDDRNNMIELCGEKGKRDLLVAAWVMRLWTGKGLRWEGDVQGW